MNANHFYPALILWLFTAIAVGWAEGFPGRPTVAETEMAVTEGTVCGAAVGERSLAASGSPTFLPYCGPRQPYVASLQQALENLAPQYIDHESGPLNPAGTDFLYFTLAIWRATADLPANGFRRATEWDGVNDPTWSYGNAQAGDIIGPWIFADLQKGFSALHWTLVAPTSENNQYKGDDFNMAAETWHTTVAAAKAEALAYYNGVTPASHQNAPEAYTTLAAATIDGVVKYKAAMMRLRRVGIFDWSSDARNSLCSEIDAYLRGVEMGTFDNQGDGITESFALVKTVAFSPGCSVDLFGTWTPVPNWPSTPPAGESRMQGYVTVYKGAITKYLAKWSFSTE